MGQKAPPPSGQIWEGGREGGDPPPGATTAGREGDRIVEGERRHRLERCRPPRSPLRPDLGGREGARGATAVASTLRAIVVSTGSGREPPPPPPFTLPPLVAAAASTLRAAVVSTESGREPPPPPPSAMPPLGAAATAPGEERRGDLERREGREERERWEGRAEEADLMILVGLPLK
uniref:Uncharacterized protein n=1 Tax=Oryza sativa subsp. japonica TaxID=39947 RepID=Q84PS3_ORYSJ|nr:hypothetical protein [Oryza sativa Japonica Group]